ncbi:MAG: hypothetical protein JSS67_03555 [Bacteroidetes bacterium]|nr:hypothetical protein [Bacteroidota bacterium]
MTRWIETTLSLDDDAQITLFEAEVCIGRADADIPGSAWFRPRTEEDALAMARALSIAAKRLRAISKELP